MELDLNKYQHVLGLLALIPEPDCSVGKVVVTPDKVHTVGGYLNHALTDDTAANAMDSVMDYLLANWAPPPDTGGLPFREAYAHLTAECKDVLDLSVNAFVGRLLAIPPEISEIVFPIAVARYLLREKMLCAGRARVTQRESFLRFARVYSALIFESSLTTY